MRLNKLLITTVAVFVIIIAFLIFLESFPNFPDPDSFYHAKMATIIRDQGFIKTFPWLQETVFNENYVNHHLLYHLLLIPLVSLFEPLVGMKVSAVIFGLAAFLTIYLFLRNLKIPYPQWLTLATALSVNFLHRMRMPRAISLSLIFLIIGTWAMMKKKYWLIFLSAFGFVWLYNGWPLLLTVFACVVLGNFFTTHFLNPLKNIWQKIWLVAKEESQTGLYLLSGLALGFISHPYFPENVYFSFLHIFKIGFFNATNNIPVGTEWYPAEPIDFLISNLPTIACLLVGVALFLPTITAGYHKNLEKEKQATLEFFTLFFLAAGTTLMTLKSCRYYEYSVPFIIFLSGILIRFAEPFIKNEMKPFFQNLWQKKIWRLGTFIIIPLALFCWTFNTLNDLKPAGDYFQTKQFSLATDWIKEHVPANETIFHNVWDYSIVLWYLDDSHRYLVGLDPVFMYNKNPERFNLWLNLVQGKEQDVSQITSVFDARVVVVDSRMFASELLENLYGSGLFTEVASNQWIKVFATNDLAL